MVTGLLCLLAGMAVLAWHRRRPTTPDPTVTQRAGDIPHANPAAGAQMRMLRIPGGGRL